MDAAIKLSDEKEGIVPTIVANIEFIRDACKYIMILILMCHIFL